MEITKREQQVLNLLAEGLRTNEIATELNVNEQTIKNDINVLKRLLVGIKATKAQLIYEACRNNLIG